MFSSRAGVLLEQIGSDAGGTGTRASDAPRAPRRVQPDGAARHRQHHADVVDHEQRQVDAQPGERVAPRGGAHQRHRVIDPDVRERERADLAGQEAASPLGGNRHGAQPSMTRGVIRALGAFPSGAPPALAPTSVAGSALAAVSAADPTNRRSCTPSRTSSSPDVDHNLPWIAVLLLGAIVPATASAAPAAQTPRSLRLMTYNLNYGN